MLAASQEIISQSMFILQTALLPVLGVSFAVALVFFLAQIIFSIQDYNLQFLVRFLLLGVLLFFTAKSFSVKYLEYAKNVYKTAPEMVR